MKRKREAREFILQFTYLRQDKKMEWPLLSRCMEKRSRNVYRDIEKVAATDPIDELLVREVLPKKRRSKRGK